MCGLFAVSGHKHKKHWAFKLRWKLSDFKWNLTWSVISLLTTVILLLNYMSFQPISKRKCANSDFHTSVCLSVYDSLSSGLLSTALYFMGALSALSCTSTNVKIEITCKWRQEIMIIAIYTGCQLAPRHFLTILTASWSNTSGNQVVKVFSCFVFPLCC